MTIIPSPHQRPSHQGPSPQRRRRLLAGISLSLLTIGCSSAGSPGGMGSIARGTGGMSSIARGTGGTTLSGVGGAIGSGGSSAPSGGNTGAAGGGQPSGGAPGGGGSTVRTGGAIGTAGTGAGAANTGGAGMGGTRAGGTSAGGTTGTGGTAGAAACTVTPAVRTLLTDVETRLAFLTTNTVDWWLAHGIDTANGGFYGTLDAQGVAVAPRDKGLIQQARHLWTFSVYYERRGKLPAAKAAADSTYQFIISHMRDAGDGEFYFKVNETGTNIVDSKKLLYAEGFAVYALAEYGRIFSVQAAKDYALACFRSMDARAHDATFKGYDQRRDAPGWLLAGVEKETNTHIHLMEAFTALYGATNDATVGARLNELIDVVATKLFQPTNYVAQNFKADWTPTGAVYVSYGHDLETAWLLLDAARAVGREAEAGLRAASLAMGKHSSERGFNATTGAYNYDGVPNSSTVNTTEHIWWVEFESLSGNYWLYRLACDPVYLTRLESTLKWIEARRDPTGEWYWGNLVNGSIGPHGTNKSDEWKASYHNMRALLYDGDWVHGTLN